MRVAFAFGCLVCGVVSSALLTAQAPTQPQQPKPTFETKAELVLVDVNVVDRESRPVPPLTPSDFSIEVNGQPRQI
ncbi:MAG TPA: hypothetical protein VFV51_08140, partial [Vicinamibacterales bacterium]|nr:hypothetical protein [Vicinamibacterales bacterium]